MELYKKRISDLGRIVTGKTPRTSNAHNYGGDIPFLTPSDDLSGKFAPKTVKTITETGLSEVKNCLLPSKSVCVSCIGSDLGKVVITNEPTVTNQQFNSIIPTNENDTDFIYYLMTIVGKHLNFLSKTSTAVPIINKSTFSDYEIEVPSLENQRRIAKVLSSLDDKIEVNRRINDNFVIDSFCQILLIWMLTTLINDNLEQQAQILFKSWFVDFEPFRDQSFVESELGLIPQGWKVGRYEDIVETTISGYWGKEKPEGNYLHKVACIRGCDFQDIKNGLRGNTPERYILEKNYQSKHFRHNDVLVEISGGTQTVSTGRVCPVSQMLIDKFNEDIVCTNFCRVVRPKTEYAAYLYYSWLYKYNNKVMFGYENGTSGIKNFRIKDFISIEPVVIPPVDVLGKFQQFVDSVQLQIQTRGSESSHLASLRDTLLPRLMSGELKVCDVIL